MKDAKAEDEGDTDKKGEGDKDVKRENSRRN